jgi:uncharacterized secreted protein with C-terminal beta-propeller domain
MKKGKKAALFTILTLAVLTASLIGALKIRVIFEHEHEEGIRRFESYQQLKQFLKSHQADAYWADILLDGSIRGGFSLTLESTALSPADIHYSTTNVQVEGVDEADIVKTDGKFIYTISEGKVLLIDAYPSDSMALLSTISLEGHPSGMFVAGNRLVLLEQIFMTRPIPREGDETFLPEIMLWMGNLSVKVYDISDRSDPHLIRNYSINGFYSDSRMLESFLYIVVGEPAMIYEENIILPRIYDCDGFKEIDATDIYYYEPSEGCQSFNTVFALNVLDENAEPSYKTFLMASSDVLFMSQDNLYIAQTFWSKAMESNWGALVMSEGEEVTAIHKMHLDGLDIEYVARGEVPGHVLNQFSMDEFNGFFRIATTSISELSDGSGRFIESNNIYVLDTEMNTVGALEDIAPGERIHSARFLGEKCYVVTFKKVDPLFIVDLSSPSDPKILGRLKIPGYSDYLHPFGEDLLIGIGKETIEAEEGDFAWYQGLKISLFDVEELDDPKEISKLVIGDRGTDSPVLRDHKAFLLDVERGILVMPVLVAEIDSSDYPNGVPANAYGEYVWQGAYILKVSAEEGIRVLGRITHLKDEGEILKAGYYFDSRNSIKRAIYIDNVLYTISDGCIKANDILTLQELNSLDL